MATRPIRRNQRKPKRPSTERQEPEDEAPVTPEIEEEAPLAPASLTALLSTAPIYTHFDIWLVGDTPLICHAWSLKARLEMLATQTKAVRDSKAARDPQADFVSSLYEMSEGSGEYGFPLTGIKNCILSMAHKDRGVPRTTVRASLQLRANIVRVRPALAGAICDMPLCRIYGGKPEMREDMVRVGAGLRKKATLAYRAQFWPWAIRIVGRVNTRMLPSEALVFLAKEGGSATGIGEWRNERDGIFGSFHPARVNEADAWGKFASGKGPLPHVDPWVGMDFDDNESEAA